MLTRRQFLHAASSAASAATVTLLLTPLGCSDSGGYGTGGYGTSTGTTVPSCDGAASTSTVSLGHTHELCVLASDLASPPAAGATYTTSHADTDGHTHTVFLSQAQLAAIEASQTVAVSSSTTEGHAHQFSITRASAHAA